MQLDDDAWRSAYAPRTGDIMVIGRAAFVRLVCGGCALTANPQPVWVERGTGTAVCPRCAQKKREAQEQPLLAMMRPNPNARRMGKSKEQFEGGGRWYME